MSYCTSTAGTLERARLFLTGFPAASHSLPADTASSDVVFHRFARISVNTSTAVDDMAVTVSALLSELNSGLADGVRVLDTAWMLAPSTCKPSSVSLMPSYHRPVWTSHVRVSEAVYSLCHSSNDCSSVTVGASLLLLTITYTGFSTRAAQTPTQSQLIDGTSWVRHWERCCNRLGLLLLSVSQRV